MCVDSNDRERIDEVREYIDNILKIEGLEGVPLLVFANKQDINGAMTPEEVEDALNLHNIKDRPYRELAEKPSVHSSHWLQVACCWIW